MKKPLLTFLTSSVLLLFPLSASAQQRGNNYGVDESTFMNYRNAHRLVADSAAFMAVVDSFDTEGIAQKDDHLRMLAADLRAKFYFERRNLRALSYIDTAMLYSKQLDLLSLYFGFYSNKAAFLGNLGRFGEATPIVESLLDEAKATGNPAYILKGYMQLAMIYEGSNQFNSAINQYLDILELMNNNKEIENPMHRLHIYRSLGMLYFSTHDYNKGNQYFDMALAIDPNLCEAPYFRGTHAMDDDNVKEFKRQYNIMMAQGHSILGTEMGFRRIMEMMNLAVDGKTEEALQIADEMGRGSIELHSQRSNVYRLAGDWKNSYLEISQYMAEKDSINAAETKSIVDKMSADMQTLYQTKEKEAQLLRQKYMLISAGIGLLALLLIVVGVIYRNREIRKKNRALVDNINQLLDMRKKEQQQHLFTPTHKAAPEHSSDAALSADSIDDEKEDNRVQIFLRELIENRRFCNPEFDRDALLSELHLQKANFWKLFEEETGTTIQKYVQNLRMEYAAEEIRQHPEYTIEAIAADCGIPSRATFYRNFSARFGITPMIFRDQCQKANR